MFQVQAGKLCSISQVCRVGTRLDLLSYALALRMIAHLMLYGLSCSFNFQTYLLSSVLLRLFECRKVVLWPLNRSLKVFLVRPMYVSFEPSSSVVTVAWYMTDFIRHWPLSGQSAGFLQLQVFSWLSCSLFFLLSSRIFLLWPHQEDPRRKQEKQRTRKPGKDL